MSLHLIQKPQCFTRFGWTAFQTCYTCQRFNRVVFPESSVSRLLSPASGWYRSGQYLERRDGVGHGANPEWSVGLLHVSLCGNNATSTLSRRTQDWRPFSRQAIWLQEVLYFLWPHTIIHGDVYPRSTLSILGNNIDMCVEHYMTQVWRQFTWHITWYQALLYFLSAVCTGNDTRPLVIIPKTRRSMVSMRLICFLVMWNVFKQMRSSPLVYSSL